MVLVGRLITVKRNEKEEQVNGKTEKVVRYSNVGFVVNEERDESNKFIPGSGNVLSVLVGKKYKGIKDIDKCLNQRFYIEVDTFKGDDGELSMLTNMTKENPLTLD